VLAIDNDPDGIARLLQRPEAKGCDRLETRVASFTDETWSNVTLVVSLLALPYCPPDRFADVWSKICQSLVPGGYLVTQLFGDRHEWAKWSFVSHSSRVEVDALLQEFDVIELEEVETPARGADGSTITAHFFNIIARKK
jgi:SAM-dependent methyltransferase